MNEPATVPLVRLCSKATRGGTLSFRRSLSAGKEESGLGWLGSEKSRTTNQRVSALRLEGCAQKSPSLVERARQLTHDQPRPTHE